MKLATNNDVPVNVNCADFADPLTFQLALPAYPDFSLKEKALRFLLPYL